MSWMPINPHVRADLVGQSHHVTPHPRKLRPPNQWQRNQSVYSSRTRLTPIPRHRPGHTYQHAWESR